MPMGGRLHAGEEPGRRRVEQHGLHHHRRDLAVVLLQEALERVEIVVLETARRAAQKSFGMPFERGVVIAYHSCQPVIAGEDDHVAARRRARDAHRGGVGLRPGLDERTISAHGMMSQSRSDTSTSSGCGSEKMLPARAVARRPR